VSARPLVCPRCGQQCIVAEDVESCIDWGPAVVDSDGIVRPQFPNPADNQQDVHNAVETLRCRAVCINDACRHQWTLRRRFEPTKEQS
jgi:hypothetical protein